MCQQHAFWVRWAIDAELGKSLIEIRCKRAKDCSLWHTTFKGDEVREKTFNVTPLWAIRQNHDAI